MHQARGDQSTSQPWVNASRGEKKQLFLPLIRIVAHHLDSMSTCLATLSRLASGAQWTNRIMALTKEGVFFSKVDDDKILDHIPLVEVGQCHSVAPLLPILTSDLDDSTEQTLNAEWISKIAGQELRNRSG